MAKDITAGAGNSYPLYLTNVGGTLFFSANDATGRELWKSDGTSAGTTQLKDINSGVANSDPKELTDVNGKRMATTTGDEDTIGVPGDVIEPPPPPIN